MNEPLICYENDAEWNSPPPRTPPRDDLVPHWVVILTWTALILQWASYLGSYSVSWSETVLQIKSQQQSKEDEKNVLFFGNVIQTTLSTSTFSSNLSTLGKSRIWGALMLVIICGIVIPIFIVFIGQPFMLILFDREERRCRRLMENLNRRRLMSSVDKAEDDQYCGTDHNDDSPSLRQRTQVIVRCMEWLSKTVLAVTFFQTVQLEPNTIELRLGGFVANVTTYTNGGFVSFLLAGILGVVLAVLFRIHHTVYERELLTNFILVSRGSNDAADESRQSHTLLSPICSGEEGQSRDNIAALALVNQEGKSKNSHNPRLTLCWTFATFLSASVATILLVPLSHVPLIRLEYTGFLSVYMESRVIRKDMTLFQMAANIYIDTPNKGFASLTLIVFCTTTIILPLLLLAACWFLWLNCCPEKLPNCRVFRVLQCMSPFSNLDVLVICILLTSNAISPLSQALFDNGEICRVLHQKIETECLVVKALRMPGSWICLVQALATMVFVNLTLSTFDTKRYLSRTASRRY